MEEHTVRQATLGDLQRVSAFMTAQGQHRCSEAYLEHWFFGDARYAGGITLVEDGERIVAMATIKSCRFRQGDRTLSVGMPQKVLTDSRLRGKGLFGRCYRAAEEAFWTGGGELLLTVTNAASTPIFLERFGFVRLPSPEIAILPPAFRAPSEQASVDGTGAANSAGVWHMLRDEGYWSWRYGQVTSDPYLTVARGGGRAVVRPIRKGRVPLALLMDVDAPSQEVAKALVQEARYRTWRMRRPFLLALLGGPCEVPLRRSAWLVRRSGFNFLMKGPDTGATKRSLQERFSLSFGDLDFF
ncbi:MAG: hypothetical protein KDB96_08285 [Flavobacteriales bacterium]|nr:hypothetical protein [Flavobacteriales bacterium]